MQDGPSWDIDRLNDCPLIDSATVGDSLGVAGGAAAAEAAVDSEPLPW